MTHDKAQSIKQLKWRMRRGMLELDLILSRFYDAYWEQLKPPEQKKFERLLEEADPDLYAWFMGYEEVTDESFKHLVTLIRRYGRP